MRLLEQSIGLIKRHKIIITLFSVLCLALLILPTAYTFLSTRGHRYDLSSVSMSAVPYHKVALVFGAGIEPDGTPTPYLRDRIETAVKLYKAKRVSKLLMTGDNSSNTHNEPAVMKKYAQKLGVPSSAIVLDDAGFNTYDSCYRAHEIFGLHDATLVSQGYHLPRAMTTCKGLGISNVGVIAEHPMRDYTANYILREFLSTDKMTFQIIFKPLPTALGKPLIIS